MFQIFTTTLEPVLGVYKDFFFNTFLSKTSKIVMISCIREDSCNPSLDMELVEIGTDHYVDICNAGKS